MEDFSYLRSRYQTKTNTTMARKNIGAKPSIMPMPVLMLSAYDENEKPCAMLAV